MNILGKSSKTAAEETEMTEKTGEGENKGKKGPDNEVAKKGGPADEPVVGEMKRGDYMVHIFIEKIKDIMMADGDDTVDPMIEIKCFQQKQFSSAKKGISGIGEVTYSEHIFLEQRNVEKKDAEDAKITLKLLDYGWVKDDVIGQFDFDLSYIYFMKDHMLLHQWLALSNPNSEDYSKITAYLKVSISVTATGDPQREIKEEEGPGDDENIMMPPQLHPKFYQIIMRFFQAQDLPAMDAEIMYLQKAKIDAFMLTHYKNKQLKTDVLVMEDNEDKKKKEHIDWNQEIWIPAQIPIISGRLVVKLMDEDLHQDETVGSLLFDLDDLIKEHCSHDHDDQGHDKSPKAADGHGHAHGLEEEDHHEVKSPFIWKNIYGSPLNLSNSKAKVEANNNPELGSMWKGRILMQIEVKETEKPIADVKRIDEKIIRDAQMFTKNQEFEIIVEIGQAINLPQPKNYTVKVIIGGHHLDTDQPKVQKGNYNQFLQRFELTKEKKNSLRLPYQSIDQMGFVIVILLDENKNPVSFWKDRVSAFTLQNAPNNDEMEKDNVVPEYKWLNLQPDLCVGKVNNAREAGMISFKMSVHRVFRDKKDNSVVENNFKDYVAWQRGVPRRLQPVKIRAYIYQGRDLPAADANGTSDPYLRVWDTTDDDIKTTVIEDTTNPQFYQAVELTYYVRNEEDLATYPPIIIDVYDEDKSFYQQTNDFMGLGESQMSSRKKPKKGETNSDDDYMARAIINLDEFKKKNPNALSFLNKIKVNYKEQQLKDLMTEADYKKTFRVLFNQPKFQEPLNQKCLLENDTFNAKYKTLLELTDAHRDTILKDLLLDVNIRKSLDDVLSFTYEDPEIPKVPQWQHVRFSPNEPTCGEILVSFSISEHDYNYKEQIAEYVNLQKELKFEEFDVDMNILGLRGLQSPGILPIKKAFIQFNIKSLVPSNSIAVDNIRTQPSASGSNPTINTTMNFQIPLPTDPLYCPKLSCMVYDYIFKGWNQPMIGVFVLPIGELMQELKDERERELDKIQKINTELEKLMEYLGYPWATEIQTMKNVNPFGNSRNSINSSFKESGHNPRKNKSIAYNRSNLDQTMTDSDLQSVGSGTRMNKLDHSLNDVTVESEDSHNQIVSTKRRQKGSHQDHQETKPLIRKNLKNSDIVKKQGAADPLGANESIGNQIALNQKNDRMAEVHKRMQNYHQIALQQKKEHPSYVDMGRRKTIDRNRRGTKTKKELAAEKKRDEDEIKRDEDTHRSRAFELMKTRDEEDGTQDSSLYVIKPKYIHHDKLQVEIETKPPPSELYMGLGWDDVHAPEFKTDENLRKKHYRFYYNQELETVKDEFPKPSPFNTYKLIRGQTRGVEQSMFSKLFKTLKKDESGQDSTLQEVGSFKGIIQIESKEQKETYQVDKKREIKRLINYITIFSKHHNQQQPPLQIDLNHLKSSEKRNELNQNLRNLHPALEDMQIPLSLANLQSDEHMKQALLAQEKCIIRLYMLEAFNLAQRDWDSPSDPYLYITCNNKIVNERDNYQLDQADPKFYKHYDFEGTFPGSSPLQIDLYDYDMIFGDDLIGTTSIDLEDRYFTLEWQSVEHKPIEYRRLYHESSTLDQGTIKCWLEINPVYDGEKAPLDISEKPEEEFEVRICVFNAKGIPMMDLEGTSDVYFRGFFDSNGDVQETDTHYRNQDEQRSRTNRITITLPSSATTEIYLSEMISLVQPRFSSRV